MNKKFKDTWIGGLLTANISNPIEGIINTGLSLVKDKTRDADTSFIRENVKKGVSISSKRVLNLTGTGAILMVALGEISKNGITWPAVGLVALGAAYSVGMAYVSRLSEK